MKKFNLAGLVLMLSLALTFVVGCGSRDDDFRFFETGFRIYNVMPFEGATDVDPTSRAIVTFSMPVDQSSFVLGSSFMVESVSLNGDIGERENVDAIFYFSDAGQTIEIIPVAGRWATDKTYFLTFTANIRSLSGDLLEPYYTMFTVGSPFGTQVSVPGAPRLVNLYANMNTGYPNECLAFEAEFNEDLSIVPNVRATLRQVGGLLWVDRTFILLAEPMFYGSDRYFWYLMPWDGYGYGCDPMIFNLSAQLTVSSFDGFDLDNTRMENNDTELYAGVNYWCYWDACQSY